MKFSFAIAGYTLPDLETGKTMDQGDIIAYKPSDWQWGIEEVKRFLIVEMDVENEEEAQKLCRTKYEDMTWEEHEAYIEAEEKEMKTIFEKYTIKGVISDSAKPQYEAEVVEAQKKYPSIPIEKKRQYNIDISKLDIDIKKMKDIGVVYQPIKETLSKKLIEDKCIIR